MSDIKFSCPACGQKIKCDSDHAGMRIPCPGCNGELEIPKLEPDAEVERGPAQSRTSGPAVSAQPAAKPTPAAAPSHPKAEGSTKPAGDLRCLCPVCRSELKIKKPGKTDAPTGTLPVAELVRPGSSGRFAASPPTPEPARTKPEPAAKPSETPSPATPQKPAEKGLHPHLGAKPRLSYILTGKPPAPLPRPDGAPRRKAKAKPVP